MSLRNAVGALGVALAVIALTASLLFGADNTATPSEVDDGAPPPSPANDSSNGGTVPAPAAWGDPALLSLAEPQPPSSEDRTGLDQYLSGQRQYLGTLNASKNADVRVTLRSPMDPTQALSLFSSSGLTVRYVEAEIPGTYEHGGFPVEQLQLQGGLHPGLKLVHAVGWGRVSDLRNLAADPRVWLVDAGGVANYYWAASAAGALGD